MTYLGDCTRCPLTNQYLVPGFGVPGGIALVGEAPGQTEIARGKPFQGASGQLIRAVLKAVDIDPDSCWWTNAALCRPPGNKTPPIDALRACNHRLLVDELGDIVPTKILPMGAAALTSLTGAEKVRSIHQWRGRAIWTEYGSLGLKALAVPTFHPAAVLRDQDLFRDMVEDLQKLLAQDEPQPLPNVELWVPRTGDECIQMIRRMSRASVISCDLENTGFDPFSDKCISVGFGALHPKDDLKGTALIIGNIFFDSEDVRLATLELLQSQSPRKAFWNGKYDLKFLEQLLGTELNPLIDDGLLMHYTLDERPGGQGERHSLKTVSRVKYDAPEYAFDFKEYFRAMAVGNQKRIMELYEYQALDCYYTIRLYNDLSREMRAVPELARVYDTILIRAQPVLKEIEKHGQLINADYLRELEIRYRRELGVIESQLQEMAEQKYFNPNSPQQVTEVLVRLAPHAYQGSTDKENLETMLKHPTMSPDAIQFVEAMMQYRRLAKLLQTYVTGFLQEVRPDGRVRTEFLLHGTNTGRLASRGPNLQNIPHYGGGDPETKVRSKEIRTAFVAPAGYTFVEADYGQLELRVAAYYSGDRRMVDTFVSGRDIHREVASEMFGKPGDQINDTERHLAKYFDFGLVYGRGAKSLAEGREMDLIAKSGGTRWTIRDAEQFMARFLSGFPDLRRWMDGQKRKAHTEHQVLSATGRIRRFPLVLGDGLAERQAINAPIQALASDLCLHALMRLHEELPRDEAHVLFTVHDSIALEVRNDVLEKTCRRIQEVMEDVQLVETDIPFAADIKKGPNWGAAE